MLNNVVKTTLHILCNIKTNNTLKGKLLGQKIIIRNLTENMKFNEVRLFRRDPTIYGYNLEMAEFQT